jgi:hypothetical protein
VKGRSAVMVLLAVSLIGCAVARENPVRDKRAAFQMHPEGRERVEYNQNLGQRVKSQKDPVFLERAILNCIARYEGGYRSINPAGPFYGRYQFLLSTWIAVARRHYPDLVGVRPDRATHAQQDAMAWALYRERGLRPWPLPNRRCRRER